MRHRQIEAFRAVIIAGSITEAGRMLRISQPAVSRLISDLEADLGLALFERRQGRIVPTPEAARLFEEVERSFIGLDRIAQAAREIRNFRQVHLSLAGMPALCLDLLPEVVARFLGQHPEAEVSIHARSSQRIVSWIAANRHDMGLAGPPFDVRGVTGELLVSAPCVCVVPPDHRLAGRAVIEPDDLDNEKLIVLTRDNMVQLRLEQVLDAAKVRRKALIETPLSVVACRLVEQRLGIAVIEPYTARYCLGRALVVKPFRPAVPFIFGVLLPEGQARSQASLELLETLRATLERFELPGDSTITIAPFR